MSTVPTDWFRIQTERGLQPFLILEGASQDNTQQALHELEEAPDYAPLFAFIPALREALPVSPMLVRVTSSSPIVSWFLSDDRFSRLGLFLASNHDTESAAKLFAGRLFLKKEAGSHVLCRWHDPQVLCDCMMLSEGSIFPFVVQGFSSVLMHGHVADCMNAWTVCDIPERNVRWNKTLPFAFIEALHEVRETRLLDWHITTLRGGVRQTVDTISTNKHGCDVRIFPRQSHAAVSQEEREAAQAELRALEAKYGITDQQDLFEARRLMTERRTTDMDALLHCQATPAHTRNI
ncbi:MAG: DUF4123 domain-containing protein [Desulfomicrobium apsheronum]|nr:DUF4123 domain-containing protein [Desulfomicrobium apsheronum]